MKSVTVKAISVGIRNFFWSAFPLVMMVLFHTPAMAMEKDTPKLCVLDNQEVWYFSLNSMVFRLPVSKDYFSANIDGLQPTDVRLIPPNPNAPMGCKDNPQQISAIWLINWPRLPISSDSPNLPKIVYQTTLRLGSPTNQDNEVGATNSKPCGAAVPNYLKKFDDGTIYCTNKPEGLITLSGSEELSWNPDTLFWRFIISKSTYRTQFGGQLFVLGFVFAGIQTSYRLAPGVVVDYNWLIPKNTIPVSPGYVIQADKLIEYTLYQYEIKNYPWPSVDGAKLPVSSNNRP